MNKLALFAIAPLATLGILLGNPRVITAAEPERSQISPPIVSTNARELYESGRYEEAIQALQQALQQERDRNDKIGEAMTERNLALVYRKIGNLEAARTHIEESLAIAESFANTPEQQQLLAQILEVQGQLYLSAGRAEEALQPWQHAAQIYRQQKDTRRSREYCSHSNRSRQYRPLEFRR